MGQGWEDRLRAGCRIGGSKDDRNGGAVMAGSPHHKTCRREKDPLTRQNETMQLGVDKGSPRSALGAFPCAISSSISTKHFS